MVILLNDNPAKEGIPSMRFLRNTCLQKPWPTRRQEDEFYEPACCWQVYKLNVLRVIDVPVGNDGEAK
jgi:hypothetical protein